MHTEAFGITFQLNGQLAEQVCPTSSSAFQWPKMVQIVFQSFEGFSVLKLHSNSFELTRKTEYSTIIRDRIRSSDYHRKQENWRICLSTKVQNISERNRNLKSSSTKDNVGSDLSACHLRRCPNSDKNYIIRDKGIYLFHVIIYAFKNWQCMSSEKNF